MLTAAKSFEADESLFQRSRSTTLTMKCASFEKNVIRWCQNWPAVREQMISYFDLDEAIMPPSALPVDDDRTRPAAGAMLAGAHSSASLPGNRMRGSWTASDTRRGVAFAPDNTLGSRSDLLVSGQRTKPKSALKPALAMAEGESEHPSWAQATGSPSGLSRSWKLQRATHRRGGIGVSGHLGMSTVELLGKQLREVIVSIIAAFIDSCALLHLWQQGLRLADLRSATFLLQSHCRMLMQVRASPPLAG